MSILEDAHYDGFSNAHNIVINEETGYAYGVGTNTYSGGIHFVNIQDPLNPVAAGGYSEDGYSHDAQVIIYNGPDATYQGREILVSSTGSEQAVAIVDVTDKNNPQGIATIGYDNVGYTHQGWFTEDHRYFLLGDEFDEGAVGFNTRTVVFDLSDLDNPVEDFEFFGETTAIDHNGYVKGNYYYLSNYAAGLRVIDISDIANGNMAEIAYFDTYPSDDNASYNGTWNVYPYFPSGVTTINDRSGGFFVVQSTQNLGTSDFDVNGFTVYPNPVSTVVTIRSNNNPIQTMSVYDVSGKLLISETDLNVQTKQLNIASLSQGMYFLNVNNQTVKRIIKK
jgi:choice-of-anchor B domain-containing protein